MENEAFLVFDEKNQFIVLQPLNLCVNQCETAFLDEVSVLRNTYSLFVRQSYG